MTPSATWPHLCDVSELLAMATATSAMLLLLALPLSARAASTLAPKNIDVALTARWSRTPVELEAAEFLAEEGGRLFWSFAEAYRSPSVSSDKAELEAVEAVASGLLSPLGLKLLRSFLAAHVFSPRVQLWRQLASSEHEAHSMQDANGWVRACGKVRSLGSSPAETAAKLADEVVADGCTMPTSLEEQETSDDVPLAVDHVYPGGGAQSSAPMVMLCAPLGSTAFGLAHEVLAKRAATGAVTYAYRPLVLEGEEARTQTLQGYGVQLAIKNMEYKVLDDQDVKDLGGIGEDAAASASSEAEEEVEVGGFFFGTMMNRRPELTDALKELKEQVAAAEGDASSLKVWAMQDLGVQAASRVLSASEPLKTLRDICQNFPFTARTLSKLPVNRQLAAEVQHLQSTMYGSGFSGLFLNGLPLPIQDNDFFGLLQTIQREMHTVDALATLRLPSKTISRLVSLPPPTASIRIQWSHPSVTYINDVEKDKKYVQFGAPLRDMTRMNMWGQMSFCRRNVLNMVFVIDPTTPLGQALLSYFVGVYMNGAPVRMGLVLTPSVSTASLATTRTSPYLPAGAGASASLRLRDLSTVYEDEAWASDPAAKAAEAAGASGAGAAGVDAAAAGATGGDSVVSRGAISDEEYEAARVGVLLTEVFHFVRKKGGSSSAARFLNGISEARQSASAHFFGGGLDDLAEHHILTALRGVVQRSSSLAKSVDPADVISQLKMGTLTEFADAASAGRRFVEDKGLGELPALLTNGVLTPLTENFEQEIMTALTTEHRSIAQLITRRVLTDDMSDLPAAIAKAGSAFPRYSRELLLPTESITVATLPPHRTENEGIAWIGAPPPDRAAREAADAAAAEANAEAKAAKAEEKAERMRQMQQQEMEMGGMFDDEMMGMEEEDMEEEGTGGGVEDAPPPHLLHSVSHLLLLDMCNSSHLSVAAGALAALSTSPGGRARLGLVFNAQDDECAAPAAAAWTALSESLSASDEPDVSGLRMLLALTHAASLGGGGAKAALASALLPKSARSAAAGASARTLAPLLARHTEYATALGLGRGEGALVTNGRIIPLGAGASLDAVDVALLEEFEFRQRAEGAAKLVATLDGPDGADSGDAASAADASWRSTVLMHAVAELSRVAQRAKQQSGKGESRKAQLQTDDLPCGAACVRIPGEGAGEAMELVAILDPLSKQAQRLAPLLMELHSALGLSITAHLNPDLGISEFPLENFYRYVVSLTPKFDDAGASLADQTDHAIFAALRTPQVLTLHVDAPEAWLVESTEAAYDMDNLKLEDLGERKTIIARYELASVLITGSCEDVSSRDPPNGLQLLLGSSLANPHATDTLVMSNLGYFQLKALPGAWTLSLAPGPSSEVYTISGEKSLMAAGHSMRMSRRVGQVDASALAPLQGIRLLVSDFGGFHALMFVQKKPNMRGVSLLEDDKAQAARGGAADSGTVLGSLSKWLGGATGDDEMVHVFSLASGLLYERFLKIMMQSVVQRTKRKVKFWLLKNFLSPAFMGFLPQMAEAVGFEYALVQYQWPTWLHKQTNKQRIIWGYKILFLDVMFPLHLKKIIYIDADQVVNADIGELWDMKLGRAAVGMTPFCQRDANQDTKGFRFFSHGYWSDHLRGRPYHISALFVVDLHKFRRRGYGDQYRIFYDSLSKDPNSLANLDQDLPNYAQHVVPIFSLPEEWLWCETWCGNASKPSAKTIDLCNNPLTKEPKLNQATRLIGERWSALDARSNEIAEMEAAAPDTSGAGKARDEL